MRWLMGLLTCLAAAMPQAQTVPQAASPGAAQQRQIEEDRRLREQGRVPQRPATDPLRIDLPAPAGATPSGQTLKFAVREIHFTPSAILGAQELDALAQRYLGPTVTLDELQKLVAEINALYRSKGVVTALALLPPQDVSSGVVTIRLVEGRLGQISMTGNASTEASYVTDRIPLRKGDLIDLGALEGALVRFNRTNDLQIAAELKPGDDLGLTDLSVLLDEPPRQQFQVFTDNLGVPSTGNHRLGVSYLNRSLLGFRDDLSLLATVADGLTSYSAAYGVPINALGGRANVGYYVSNTSITNGTLAPLNLSGESTATLLSLRQPTYVSRAAQLDVLLGAGWSRISTDIDGVTLQHLDTSYQSIGLEGQFFEAQASTFASYAYTAGQVTSEPQRDFGTHRAALRHNRDVAGDWTAWLSAAGQWSNDVLLPSNQQYFIGGEGSVRGYATGLLAGDQGYSLSLEMRHPLPLPATAGDAKPLATGFVFIDYGAVNPFRPPDSVLANWQHLTGAGLGVRASLGRSLFGTLTVAYGLTDVPLVSRPYEVTFQFGVSF